MNFYEALLLVCLVIVAVSFLVLLLTRLLHQSSKADTEARGYRISWMETMIQQTMTDSRLALKEERSRNQTLLNILLSKDLPTMMALQHQTVSQGNDATSQMKSEYIPRDDISEYMRAQNMQNFLANAGIGEAILGLQADPEFNQVMGDLGVNEMSFAEDGG